MNIELSAVSYSEGGAHILKDIEFNASEHRIGVVGRNGSGKSTLARLLCGLIAPSSGSVQLYGVDVFKDRHAAIKTVGMLFQNPDHQIIFPTVEEELAFGLTQLGLNSSEASLKVAHLLEQFEATHWLKKSVSVLSQGQRHLVCLMAILLMQPRLVILDEPYAGLDIPTAMQLNQYLSSIDAAIVHISHQPETFNHYDRVLWLEEGKIVLDDSPATVLPEFTQQMKELGRSHALV
ncbi:UNVERIFIED_CONTAM: hypothetical protein GTU68_036632 [Idotea baltica]|nr:hypothetical protein [Idotea baltica]